MKLSVIDYHVSPHSVSPSADALASFVNQDVVGSVFIVNPLTGLLDDALSQVLSDPSSPKSQSLLSVLPRVHADTPSHLSDDELMALVRSRYCSTPSEVAAFTEHLRSLCSEPDSNPSSAASSSPQSSEAPDNSNS